MNRRRRNACLGALEEMRGICGDVQLSDALAFLYICENEGINISELAQLAGLGPSSASRAARRLIRAGAPCALAPSLGLIEMSVQRTDRRGRILTLTPGGQRLRTAMEALIAAATPIALAPLERAKD